jgi:hypothetical protein
VDCIISPSGTFTVALNFSRSACTILLKRKAEIFLDIVIPSLDDPRNWWACALRASDHERKWAIMSGLTPDTDKKKCRPRINSRTDGKKLSPMHPITNSRKKWAKMVARKYWSYSCVVVFRWIDRIAEKTSEREKV